MSLQSFFTGKPETINDIVYYAKKLNYPIIILIVVEGPYIDRHERKGLSCRVIYSLDVEHKVLKTMHPGFGFTINISKKEGLNVDLSHKDLDIIANNMLEQAYKESLNYIEFISSKGIKFKLHKKINLSNK